MQDEIKEEYEKHKGNLVRVWQIKNTMPGPEKGKRYWMVSPLLDERGIVARVRDLAKSKTSRGGAKELSKTMDKLGGDYHELFTLKPITGFITKDRATEIRNKLSKAALTKSGKVYNKPAGAEDK